MGRTKAKSKKVSRADKATPAAPEPQPTPEELMFESARLIASSDYEQAKAVCRVALQQAVELKDSKLCTDALEILGTVELELRELDEARQVS